MRLMRILFLVQLMSTFAYGQNRSFLVGETQDCFAGRLIHPAQVDIYLFDSLKAPEISAILNDLEKQAPTGNDQNMTAFLATYGRLKSAIQKTKALRHVRSDEAGRFSFQGLKAETKTLVLGFAEREDEPAYYAYLSLSLRPGKNPVRLDFDRGSPCVSR
jgi:hypothetical protein